MRERKLKLNESNCFITLLFLFSRDADLRKGTLCPFCIPIHKKKKKKKKERETKIMLIKGNLRGNVILSLATWRLKTLHLPLLIVLGI